MSTSLFAYLNGSDIGYKVRLNGIGLSARADGSVGVGGIEFDDQAASLTVRGWMSVIVKEVACTAAPVLFTGYIADRTYTRVGQAATYRTGASRFINANLIDQNAITHVNLITGSDGKRPAETQVARIAWITGSNYWPGSIDQTLVDTTHVRPFEAADYRGQFADDVLNDIAGPIFRIFFIYPVQPNGNRGLFFDTPDALTTASTLTLSNVLSDKTSTCFIAEATLMRDPSEVYARIRYVYANGVAIENLSSTRDTFFLDNGLGYRGLNVNNSRVGLDSTARSMADLLLTRDAGENDKLTVNVQLPPASVGLIDAGQRVGVRFTHLPGFDPQVFTRVVSRTIQQTPGNDQLYDVTLELSTHGLSSAGGGGAPGPGVFPSPPPATAVHYYGGTFTWSNSPGGSHGWAKGSTDPTLSDGTLNSTTATSNSALCLLVNGTTYNYTFSMENAAGDPGPPGMGLIDSTSGAHVLGLGGYSASGTIVGTGTNVYAWGSEGGTNPHTVTFQVDPVGWDTGGGAIPPQPAQWVGISPPEVVVMSGVNGTTAWPFADGSLRVFYDIIEQTAAIVSYNGAAGTFVMPSAPALGTQVFVQYQGR